MSGKIVDGNSTIQNMPTELLMQVYKNHIYEKGNENVINMSITQNGDYVFVHNTTIMKEYEKRIANE